MLCDNFISFSFHPSISDKKQEIKSCNSPSNYTFCGFHQICAKYLSGSHFILLNSIPMPCCLLLVLSFSVVIVINKQSCPYLPPLANPWIFLQITSSVGCTTNSLLLSRNEVSRNVRKLPVSTYIFKNKKSEGAVMGLGRAASK